MSTYKRFLSERELAEELEDALVEIDTIRNEQVNVDVVYIPPEVDALTDEEDFDENILLENNSDNREVAGTYELQVDKCGEGNEEPVAAKKIKYSTTDDIPPQCPPKVDIAIAAIYLYN